MMIKINFNRIIGFGLGAVKKTLKKDQEQMIDPLPQQAFEHTQIDLKRNEILSYAQRGDERYEYDEDIRVFSGDGATKFKTELDLVKLSREANEASEKAIEKQSQIQIIEKEKGL